MQQAGSGSLRYRLSGVFSGWQRKCAGYFFTEFREGLFKLLLLSFPLAGCLFLLASQLFHLFQMVLHQMVN